MRTTTFFNLLFVFLPADAVTDLQGSGPTVSDPTSRPRGMVRLPLTKTLGRMTVLDNRLLRDAGRERFSMLWSAP